MISKGVLLNTLTIDIETVSKYKTFEEFCAKDEVGSNLFLRECEKFINENDYPLSNTPEYNYNELYKNKACLYPEFSNVISIVVGRFENNNGVLEKKTSCISMSNFKTENDLLVKFSQIVNHEKIKDRLLAGHGIINFDIPFLIKRFLHHKLAIPFILNTYGKKPWDIKVEDTLKLFQFSGNRYMSLELVAYLLNIPSSKKEMSGKDVFDVFYNENDMQKIDRYCKSDVIVVMDIIEYLSDLKSV